MDGPYYYPVNDFGPMMKGMVIGGLGIFHVFLAQFAIGGGMLMCWLQWTAMRRRDAVGENARVLINSYFKFLVLISFVLGALTGVAMWFTTIQISPRTIGVLVDEFHWLWATEWTFFAVEVVSGYLFYRYATRLDDRLRLRLLVIYSIAAWMSLFWINGILSFQLTPGSWSADHRASWTNLWAGFFNPSFWPSLIYRSIASLSIAVLVACVVINTIGSFSRKDKTRMISHVAWLLSPMILMPVLGAWYYLAMPLDSRSWITGGSATMTLFMNMAAGASLLIGAYALVGLWRRRLYINAATASLLTVMALIATAGGEFVREGVRKPFTIRQQLYSNSIKPDEVAHLRLVGSVSDDPYPLRHASQYPNEQIRLGAKVYRFQCAVCHTLDGVNGLSHLTDSWDADMKRHNIAKLQQLKNFMPPFAGTPEELEALVQMLNWRQAGQPDHWPETNDAETLSQIEQWLREAPPEAPRPPAPSPGGAPRVTLTTR